MRDGTIIADERKRPVRPHRQRGCARAAPQRRRRP
jgi:hypothetical protein